MLRRMKKEMMYFCCTETERGFVLESASLDSGADCAGGQGKCRAAAAVQYSAAQLPSSSVSIHATRRSRPPHAGFKQTLGLH